LFPVFARARENARRASCQSNLKQISLGMLQYTQDYDEKYPYAAWNNGTTLGLHWLDSSMPYIKSRQIWVCPSATPNTARDTGSWPAWNGAGNGNQGAFYSWNEDAMNKSLSECNNPAVTYLMTDRGDDMCFTAWYGWQGRMRNDGSGKAGPHLEGKNIAFADGHVKFFPASRIVARDVSDGSNGLDANSPYYALFRN
jgi:prepilin-type processing-associated H-X9-DG protein